MVKYLLVIIAAASLSPIANAGQLNCVSESNNRLAINVSLETTFWNSAHSTHSSSSLLNTECIHLVLNIKT